MAVGWAQRSPFRARPPSSRSKGRPRADTLQARAMRTSRDVSAVAEVVGLTTAAYVAA